ncbi:hypothetical protein FRACYDRAFT_252975 [Fragilariopsis cylindrus CCMP1102]|uniref:Uncharacterized protein n=1 Tax=Fragilariopsis cylindrus CCMP1102 TaxID=635003 RepID=A0A1E7ELP6_9STRA|nr:hypothetical protein FRACYDRAFT_252975 [Fragilariopsis cylindrus CCMP1102]|eukprot:OEU06838.1 hypothetical protein FRACYDRAFT_252975 [Fragilariopsis cylindrus CCMP1102]
MINPPNQVQYLIIQDSSKRGRKNQLTGGEKFDDDEEEQQQLNGSFISSTINRYRSFIFSGGESKIDDDVNDDESYYVSMDSLLDDGDDGDGEQKNRRLLKKFVDFNNDSTTNNNNYGDDINLAVLHVSYSAGQTLFNWIANADPQIHREGGLRVLLNSRESNSSFEEDQQQNAPRRPVRRRLTLEQVRSKFPAFHFDPTEHPQNHPSTSSNINNDVSDPGLAVDTDELVGASS